MRVLFAKSYSQKKLALFEKLPLNSKPNQPPPLRLFDLLFLSPPRKRRCSKQETQQTKSKILKIFPEKPEPEQPN